MASQAAASIVASTSIVPKEEEISSESNQTTNLHEVTIHVSFLIQLVVCLIYFNFFLLFLGTDE